MAVKLDQATSTVLYIGKTEKGNSTAAPVWTITRLSTSGNIDTLHDVVDLKAGKHVWDDRTTYTYG